MPRPVVGVFDAGIGGVPLAALLDRAGYDVVYLGDAARRPYGPQDPAVITTYVSQAERFFQEAGCDLWVIACNTASVVAPTALQALLPCVDMVAAVRADLSTDGSGPLGLVATASTVASGAYPLALSSYDVHQLATEELLRLAEEGSSDSARIQELAKASFDELRAAGCDTVVLACTDFTCVMEDLQAVADEIRLIDPLQAAAALVDAHLPDRGEPSGKARHRLVLTGPHPVDVPAYARERFGLDLPDPEYRDITQLELHREETAL